MPIAMWLLPVPGAADQHDVALRVEEGAGGELLDQLAVDRRAVEGEVGQLLGQRQLGDAHLVVDRSRVLGRDLGLEQRADHASRRRAGA